ncbi:MAG TPA: T9SS type A sorting domain-containing protein [Candidatus Kapabacteria bacterium]|nr:T9SS type A sorting domain-containing protein [Candidatus Kapabacteria bacterium]
MKKIIFSLILTIIILTPSYSQWVNINPHIWGVNPPIREGNITALVASGDTVYAALDRRWGGGLYVSTDLGDTWVLKKVVSGDGNINHAHTLAIIGNRLIKGNMFGCFISTNMGDTWRKVHTADAIITLATNGKDIYAAGESQGLYLSTDKGDTWADISPYDSLGTKYRTPLVFPTDGILDAELHEFVFVGDTFIARVGGSFVTIGRGILVTPDKGRTWIHKIIDTTIVNGLYGDDISQITTIGNKLLVTSTEIPVCFLETTDLGDTWNIFGKRLPSDKPAILETDGKNLFVGTSGDGVFISTDMGESWLERNDGITFGGKFVTGFVISNGYVFVRTHEAIDFMDANGGLYRAKIEDLIKGVDVKETTEQRTTIYPNPAHDYIYINSSLIDGAGGIWQYQIYDLLGNCVQSGIIESDKINISQLSSGFYTVRFFNGGKQVVEKMMKE